PSYHRTIHQEHAFRGADLQERARAIRPRARRGGENLRRIMASDIRPRADPAAYPDVDRDRPARLYVGGPRYQYGRSPGLQPIAHDGAACARLCFRRAIRARVGGGVHDFAGRNRRGIDLLLRKPKGGHQRALAFVTNMSTTRITDLRSYLKVLEEAGELSRVKIPVN